MPETLRIALAQINPHAGDIAANLACLRAARAAAAGQGAALVLAPELALTGLAGDWLRSPDFLAASDAALAALAAETADGGPALLLGAPWREGGRLFNAAHLLDAGRIQSRSLRHAAGTDGFAAGPSPGPLGFRGWRLGVTVGADWRDADVAETLAETGAELLVALAAEPFIPGTTQARRDLALQRVVETGLGLVWLNPIGGQDEWVFEGSSFVLNPDHRLAALLPAFYPAVTITEWQRHDGSLACQPLPLEPDPEPDAALSRALHLALRDAWVKGGYGSVAHAEDASAQSTLLWLLCNDARLTIPEDPSRPVLWLPAVDRAGMLLGEGAGQAGFALLRDLGTWEIEGLVHWEGLLAEARRDPDCPGRDGLVEALIDRAEALDALAARGHDPAALRQLWARLQAAEPARRQSPPGLRLGRRDLRLPLGPGFRGVDA